MVRKYLYVCGVALSVLIANSVSAFDFSKMIDNVKQAGEEALKKSTPNDPLADAEDLGHQEVVSDDQAGGCDKEWFSFSNRQLGTVGGAILGAVITKELYDRYGGKNKALAIALAGGVGGLLGGGLGARLDVQEQEALAQASVKTALSGKSQYWENSDRTVNARTKVVCEGTYLKTIPIAHIDDVDEIVPSVFENRSYRVTRNARVRSGPGTGYKMIGMEKQGAVIGVNGEVNSNGEIWKRLSEAGVVVGYIHSSLLLALDETAPTVSEPAGPTKTVENTETINIKKIEVTLSDVSSGTSEVGYMEVAL